MKKVMNMKDAIWTLRYLVHTQGQIIQTAKWQGIDNPPAFKEYLHADMKISMIDDVAQLRFECDPFMPWADIHFQERVGGVPLNPPPSHKLWLKGNEKFMSGGEKFSHSYPERFWSTRIVGHYGIRFGIGDFNDLITLLQKEPDTRQAYLPIWFPEDIYAACAGERVPCTLGYHFIVRNGQLDLFYPMRSCDVLRHMHNDLYMANLLALEVIDRAGLDCKVGDLHFHVTSLHCFKDDEYMLKKSIGLI